jgi:hypothetical protein
VVLSTRDPDRLPPLQYPGHFVVKEITPGVTFRFQTRLNYLANAMVDQHIGLDEVEDSLLGAPARCGLGGEHRALAGAAYPTSRRTKPEQLRGPPIVAALSRHAGGERDSRAADDRAGATKEGLPGFRNRFQLRH